MNTWIVFNEIGDLAGHDMSEAQARQCERTMQEREPGAGWEALNTKE